ncbi:Fic family protein [Candidatus Micrarchaeota archaeon]|nr:Fic family protein [Candidatus Micrarchaeota archaeon]
MHLEIREGEGIKKYYLAHSIRKAGKVRKLRVYLGSNLTETELQLRMQDARKKLSARVDASRQIPDPFETVLSAEELEELRTLEAKAHIKIAHLSEEDWIKFTEAFTFNTNAIEGSTIEPKEVVEILENDKWPDKSKGDISETYGVAKAIEFIRKTDDHLSLPLILELHRIVFENSKPFAGKLRENGVEVVVTDGHGGIVHQGASSTRVRVLLLGLVRWYDKSKNHYPPLVLAAVVHNQFENIHPFQDGNGRVGRLLLNNILLKHKMPPINIELKNRQQYYAALQAYEKKHNLRPTIELMLKEYRALKLMLKKR